MKLYVKVLAVLKPFWKLIALSVFLSFIYIFFNNSSLWVSVDFIQELFNPQQINVATDSSTVKSSDNTSVIPFQNSLQGDEESLYQKIRLWVKSLLIQENRFDTLKVVCFIIFITYFLKNIIAYLRRLLLNFIELKIIVSLRNKLNNTLLKLPVSYFEKNNTGELTSVVFNDVSAVNIMLNNSFGKMILSPLQIVVNLTILVLINWKLSLITFSVIPFSVYLISAIGKIIRRRSRRVFQQIANVVSIFQETMGAVRIVKAFNREEHESKRFDDAVHDYFKKNFRANSISYLTSPLNEVFVVIVLVVLLWYGGNLVYKNEGLLAEDFIRYLVFLLTLFQPLKNISHINNVIQVGLAATERIFKVMDSVPEVYDSPEAKPMKPFREKIQFNNVNFRYNDDGEYVLKNVNLEISNNETLAIVGHSGAGKSTLVDLIPRFYDINDGSITIDNVDIRDVTLKSLRDQIGIVTQDAILFNDTIKANISYGLDNCTQEQIENAAKLSNSLEFINQMPNGFDTNIGERGNKLSGGQKQRLTIARALIMDPPILILDEATSALDSKSEYLVKKAIDNLRKNRTVFVIAHRLSTIKNADSIIVLENGKIIAQGTHKKLLQTSETYKKLNEMQFVSAPEHMSE